MFDNYNPTPNRSQPFNRHQNGKQIAEAGGVAQVDDPSFGIRAYSVQSQSNPKIYYSVHIHPTGQMHCNCPDAHPRCKHIHAVQIVEENLLNAGWEGFRIDNQTMADDVRAAAEMFFGG